MVALIGILDGSDGVYGVRIPDVPGCHGGGATVEEAIAEANSALQEMAEQIDVAQCRSIEEIKFDPIVTFDESAGESFVVLNLCRSPLPSI